MMRRLLPIIFAVGIIPLMSQSQVIYNLNNQDLNFGGTGVTITAHVGSGTAVGDVVLYENVVTIGSQQIDAIVRTVALTGTMTDHDNPSTSGPGMSNNQARFFSPQFSFSSGGGSCEFEFEFIEGGTYNTGTNTGTVVGLTNVLANTYDIDGNGGSGTNQFNEFGGFDTVSLGNPTNIGTSYNTSTGLTRFRSNSSTNVSNVLDDRTRVHVGFPVLTTFRIVVGADGSGAAYFFIDFGSGASWSSTPDVFEPPVLDLDTTSTGVNRLDTFCQNPTYFSNGNASLTTSTGNVDELQIGITSSEILDGSTEKLVISGATTGDTIALNFSHGASLPVVSFFGVNYTISATVVNGESLLSFLPSSSITVAQANRFIDSLVYVNDTASTGIREFDVYARDGSFLNVVANYQVNVNCGILPVDLLSFRAKLNGELAVELNWVTSSEHQSKHFVIERSTDAQNWIELAIVESFGWSESINIYDYIDQKPLYGLSFYRLREVDYDDRNDFSQIEAIEIGLGENKHFEVRYSLDPGILYIVGNYRQLQELQLYNLIGEDLTSHVIWNQIEAKKVELNMSELPSGIYTLVGPQHAQTLRKL